MKIWKGCEARMLSVTRSEMNILKHRRVERVSDSNSKAAATGGNAWSWGVLMGNGLQWVPHYSKHRVVRLWPWVSPNYKNNALLFYIFFLPIFSCSVSILGFVCHSFAFAVNWLLNGSEINAIRFKCTAIKLPDGAGVLHDNVPLKRSVTQTLK